MTDTEIIEAIGRYGLFIVRLNNGDWVVGKANYVYSIEITQNHYKDENLSISVTLDVAISEWIKKNRDSDGRVL